MAALVTHNRVHKAWKARLAFQLFADKICLLLAKVCQGTKILHNFERFVDLPQNRNFLTLFGFDALFFQFTKERYVVIPPELGRTEKRKKRGSRTLSTRNAAFSLSAHFTRVAVDRGGMGRGMKFPLDFLLYYPQITGETNSEQERMVGREWLTDPAFLSLYKLHTPVWCLQSRACAFSRVLFDGLR